jgi:hypothetical protein
MPVESAILRRDVRQIAQAALGSGYNASKQCRTAPFLVFSCVATLILKGAVLYRQLFALQ